MKIKEITTDEGFRSLEGVWNNLVKESGNDLVHLTHEWMTAWWDNFGGGGTLNILAAFDAGGRAVGIAPLMLRDSRYRGVPVKKLSLMANGHSPSGDVIVRDGCHREFTAALIEYLKGRKNWHIAEFFKVRQEGQTYRILLEEMQKDDCRFGVKSNIVSPYITIAGPWEEFFQKRSTRFRKSIRNKINRINRSNDVTVERVALRGGSDAAFEVMVNISGKSWKKRIGEDLLHNQRNRQFYVGICDKLGPKGLITIWLLKKAGVGMAFEFHITHDEVTYPIRADFDDDYNELSPGSVLEYNIIKTLFEESKVKEYNTCGHTYNYLLNWTDDCRVHADIQYFNRGAQPYLAHLLEYRLIPVLRKLKRRHGGNGVIKSVRAATGD